jgi:hypothetical protein
MLLEGKERNLKQEHTHQDKERKQEKEERKKGYG